MNTHKLQTIPAASTPVSAPAPALAFGQEEISLIKRMYFPQGTSDLEMAYCMGVSRTLGLNPITKEIHFVPRRQQVNGQWVNKVEPMVGRDGFLSIAHRSGEFDGMSVTSDIKPTPVYKDGRWTYNDDLVATCSVYRTGRTHPVVVEVSFHEYVQTDSNGQPTKFWREKGETMLKKVAESQALRKAFNISGVYTPEEMGVGLVSDEGDLLRDNDVASQQEPPRPSASETIETLTSLGMKPELNGEMLTVEISFKDQESRAALKQMGFTWNGEAKYWQLHVDPYTKALLD